jgi:hypothetical protein
MSPDCRTESGGAAFEGIAAAAQAPEEEKRMQNVGANKRSSRNEI